MSTLTVTEAKASFGRLADRALRTGKPVIVKRKGRLVQIARYAQIDPLPIFPVGSLKVTRREIELDQLAGPDVGPEFWAIKFSQWDVVKVRINPGDRDEHPAVVVSREEICSDERKPFVNVLYGSTKRPADEKSVTEIQLNGADGLERPTVFSCTHLYTIHRSKISQCLGRVAPERRRQIGRAIVALYRLPLWATSAGGPGRAGPLSLPARVARPRSAGPTAAV
jgi:mRNA-degrading endonuclease toxin of MazEF toxin-antitoxin module